MIGTPGAWLGARRPGIAAAQSNAIAGRCFDLDCLPRYGPGIGLADGDVHNPAFRAVVGDGHRWICGFKGGRRYGFGHHNGAGSHNDSLVFDIGACGE